ncbi:hypothetical protein ACLB2K_022779 [Fragaria x ananassa]
MGLYDYSAGGRTAGTYLWMKKFMKSGNHLEHEAFLVFWLSRYVFNYNTDLVNKAVFSIAIRLARGIRVALALAVLAGIYSDLSLLNMTIVSSNELNVKNAFVKLTLKSQFQLVQVWAWERFLEIRPKSKVICCGEPRLAQWDEVDCLNVGDMRGILDAAGEGFIWRPYAMAIKNWSCPKYYVEKEEWVLVGTGLDEELLSFAKCLRVAELVGFHTKQKYLPHRVARQFGFDQDLPCSVSGHGHNYQNAKLYIPSRLSEADVTIRYLNWWKESVSGLGQKCMPPEKRANKAVVEIHDAIPCICSTKNSEEFAQVCAGRNDGENSLVPYSLVPPGLSLKRNIMEAGVPMDEDDLTISEALILGKKLKTVETRKGTTYQKSSCQDQIFPSSVADESSMNIKSAILANEGALSSKVLTWGGKGWRKLDKVIRSKERSSSMWSMVGNASPSSTSSSDKLEFGSSMSLFEKQEYASSSSLFEKQDCTSSSFLFGKLECASISPAITDDTFVNTKKAQRSEKQVPLIKALIWGGKGKRKMKTVKTCKARSSSLFEKGKDGNRSSSFEKRASELRAKVKRLENVVQVLKESTFGRSRLIGS